jgi:hypothetical protein
VKFADYVRRREEVELGEKLGLNAFPPTNDASIVPLLQDGALNTTSEEYQSYINQVPQPNVGPTPTPSTVPSPPTSLVATIGDSQVSIAFTPGSNGGSAITNYQYSTDGGATFTPFSPAQTSSPVVITGLTNGTEYTIQLKAVNTNGASVASASVLATPATYPDPPTGLSATPGDQQVTISFTAGADNGSAIINYQYSLNGGNYAALSPPDASSPITITGLTNGTSYTITLEALNELGSSIPSGSVTITTASAPQAPTITSITEGNGQVSIYYTTGSDGGSPIINYVYSTDGGFGFANFDPATTANPLVITGLTNGVNYGFAICAKNVVGNSPRSNVVFATPSSITKGATLWATSLTGTDNNAITNITKDGSGNVYVVGTFAGTMTIQNYASAPVSAGAVGVSTYATMTSDGSNDVFIIKYNSSGQAQWATAIGGTGSENATSVAVDSAGSVYVCGVVLSSAMFKNYSSVTGGAVVLTEYGQLPSNAGFLVKYNSSGVIQWVTKPCQSTILGVKTDGSGNIYVVATYGSITHTIYSFGSAPGAPGGQIGITAYGTTTAVSAFGQDNLIVKYNTNGVVQWATSCGGSGNNDYVKGLAVDSSGNVMITGYFDSAGYIVNSAGSAPVAAGPINLTPYGTINKSIATSDIFIIKFDTSGTVLWVTKVGANGIATNQIAYNITSDSNNNIFVTGYIQLTATFYSAGSVISGTITPDAYGTFPNAATYDIFLAKYNSDGAVQWVTKMGSSSVDTPFGLTTDSSNNVYISGYVGTTGATPSKTTVYNYTSPPPNPTSNVVLTAYGTTNNPTANYNKFDTIIVKYNSSGTVQWVNSVYLQYSSYVNNLGLVCDGSYVYATGIFFTPSATIKQFTSDPATAGGDIGLTTYGTLATTDATNADSFIIKIKA